jgi:hypothetical protein
MWEPRRLTTLWAFTACHMDSFYLYPSTNYNFCAGIRQLFAVTSMERICGAIYPSVFNSDFVPKPKSGGFHTPPYQQYPWVVSVVIWGNFPHYLKRFNRKFTIYYDPIQLETAVLNHLHCGTFPTHSPLPCMQPWLHRILISVKLDNHKLTEAWSPWFLISHVEWSSFFSCAHVLNNELHSLRQ